MGDENMISATEYENLRDIRTVRIGNDGKSRWAKRSNDTNDLPIWNGRKISIARLGPELGEILDYGNGHAYRFPLSEKMTSDEVMDLAMGLLNEQGIVFQDALIVIDVQNDFCPGGSLAVSNGNQIIEGINEFMEGRSNIVLTQDWHSPDHMSFASSNPGKKEYEMIDAPYGAQILWPDHCVKGSRGAEFHPELNANLADMIIRKGTNPEVDSYSAFFENDRKTKTGLHSFLKERNVVNVTMAGLALDYCVAWSAIDAVKLGFSVTVRLDLCKAIDLNGSLSKAMKDMLDAGVELKWDD